MSKVRSPHHEVEDLTAILGELIAKPDRLAELGVSSRHHVGAHHDPSLSVETYAAVIEQTIACRRERDASWHKATAGLLESTPLAYAERDHLIAQWAALREMLRPETGRSAFPTRTAA